ncbi:MAG: phage portal protein [Candidatus Omnitrophica bacterium]|nr:phage portal protein [Candidatus Omnitrophota bacterium]
MISKPSLFERAKIAFDVFRNGFPRVSATSRNIIPMDDKEFSFIWPTWRVGQPQYKMIDIHGYINDGFNINSLIYSAIMFKARSSVIAKIRAYEGDPENPTLCKPDHPLAKLLTRPNPTQSWSEFQMRQMIFFNLTGDAFALLLKPKRDSFEGASFIGLDSSRVFIIPEKEKSGIMGYVYVPEGKTRMEGIPLLPEYVSHVKLPNPSDPLEGYGYGLSPLSPASRTASVDNAITDFIKVFFEKGAVVPGLLSTDQILSPETAAMLKERWKENYGGYHNWTDVGVMDKGTKYERIGMNFQEMSFAEQDERNEARICGVFGVPISILDTRSGIKASTYNNKENDRRMFWEDVMLPEIGLFENDYKYYLNDGNAFVKMDYSDVPALKRDIPKAVDAAYKLWSMGETRANAYAMVGLEPIGETPGADTSYLPINIMPIDSETEEIPTTNTGAASSEDEDRDKGKMKFRRSSKK